jgi:hypothetical protein
MKKIPALFLLAPTIACLLGLPACGKKGAAGTATVTSVSITPAGTAAAPISVSINQTANFTAAVNLTDGTTSTSTTVTWEVNGVAGGSATTGTIVASTTNAQMGIYTAPSVVPSTNNGQVNITAVAPKNPGPASAMGSSTDTVTSNTSVVQIGAGLALAVTPQMAIVPAGGTSQFSARLNGLADPNATWSASSSNGGDVGTINPQSGLYTAPSFPPPGGSVTITATDPAAAAPAIATADIDYSDRSFNGPFAFSYTGNDSSGFQAVAGSFVVDGNGHVVSGIEDSESSLNGTSSQVSISGTYAVGPDGRGSASISAGRGIETWQFVLTTNQHALLTRFDRNITGSGTMDQQTLPLTTSVSQLNGPFVFGVAGVSASFAPEGAAGRFNAQGDGTIPATGSTADINNNGAITRSAALQASTYGFDIANPGTGRGTITLHGIGATPLTFAFYVIDSTSSQGHLHLVENDGNAFLAGEMFAGLSGGPFSASSLAAGNYAFTSGGTSSAGASTGHAFAAGGVFTSDGNGNITGGVLDTNNGGTATTATAINSCTYSVDPTTGRVALTLFTGSGACPASPSSTTPQFALYQTALGSGVLIELDSSAVSAGIAFQQAQPVPTAAPSGNLAFALAGQGAFHNSPALFQPDVDGQMVIGTNLASGTPPGNIDINNFNAVFKGDAISSTGLTAGTPDAHGRGTLTFAVTDPAETFNLIYYIIDAKTALLLDKDASPIAIGVVARQF